MQIFKILDKTNPDTENTMRSLLLTAVKHTTVQVTAVTEFRCSTSYQRQGIICYTILSLDWQRLGTEVVWLIGRRLQRHFDLDIVRRLEVREPSDTEAEGSIPLKQLSDERDWEH
jgi:hypothetical protein